MTLRHEPALAKGLMKLFCSNAEYESVIGDLSEQYQEGRGRLWYWRQAIDIVFLALYCKVARRPLVPAHRVPAGQIFTAVLLIVALAAVLLSDIAWILLIPVVIGILIGLLPGNMGESPSEGPGVARIDSSKIPIGGGVGAGLV